MTVKLHHLLGLWRGDEWSTGFIHEGLAREICRHLRPGCEEALLRQLWPPEGLTADADARTIAITAYEKWRQEKPRRKDRM